MKTIVSGQFLRVMWEILRLLLEIEISPQKKKKSKTRYFRLTLNKNGIDNNFHPSFPPFDTDYY